MRRRRAFTSYLFVLAATGCRSVYYETMDAVGYEQSEILRNRMQEVHQDQLAAQQRLQSALSTLEDGRTLSKREVRAIGEELEKLSHDIESMDDAAQVTFQEWQKELEEIRRRDERRESAERMEEARQSYGTLETKLRDIEARFEEVMVPLQRRASSQEEREETRDSVSTLLDRMESSIEEMRELIGEDEVADRSRDSNRKMLATLGRRGWIR